MATLGDVLVALLVLATVFVLPIVIFLHGFGEELGQRWEEWHSNRGYRTFRFVVTAYSENGREVTLPVWFEEQDFGEAAQDAIEFQDRLFGSTTAVGITAVDRSWGYVREPEEWGSNYGDVQTMLLARIEELVDSAGLQVEFDPEFAADILEVVRRLMFIAEVEATCDEREDAWAIAEEGLVAAAERALARREDLETP